MQAFTIGRAIAGAALLALLAGCGGGREGGGLLSRFGSQDTPDEFLVLPKKPLEEPPSYTELPQPTPGAGNITDVNPNADAIIALGGRPAGSAATGSDRALLAAARAGQRAAGIRATLAEEDGTFRRRSRGRLLERIFGADPQRRVYGSMVLDADAEAARLRALGVRVPPAPPLQ